VIVVVAIIWYLFRKERRLGCDYEIATTNNSSPSPPSLLLLLHPTRCVVAIGDLKGPPEWHLPPEATRVVYLNPDDQKTLPYHIMKHVPWNHFSRKNIGFLYALHHGARVIYDTDDDNMLVDEEKGIPYEELMGSDEVEIVVKRPHASRKLYNPYVEFKVRGGGHVCCLFTTTTTTTTTTWLISYSSSSFTSSLLQGPGPPLW